MFFCDFCYFFVCFLQIIRFYVVNKCRNKPIVTVTKAEITDLFQLRIIKIRSIGARVEQTSAQIDRVRPAVDCCFYAIEIPAGSQELRLFWCFHKINYTVNQEDAASGTVTSLPAAHQHGNCPRYAFKNRIADSRKPGNSGIKPAL